MCGLTGIWSRAGTNAELRTWVQAMTDSLAHRGPDSDGHWLDGQAGIALGHRRLSVIDLSPTGHQPMISACGRWVISYNGEVYNYRELRRRLGEEGVAVRGDSDTEVILEACARWGPEKAIETMIGMFAFALWDRQRRELRLVRDRLGIKPLYWSESQGLVLFGSELKALRACPAFAAQVDERSVATFMRHGYVPSPHSIYRDAQKLPPGVILTVPEHGAPASHRYWNAQELALEGLRDPEPGDDGEHVMRMEALLTDAVRMRMVADVPLGAFLSGGTDSSAVVALMQSQASEPVRTFTIGFNESGYDEARHAGAIARHLGTRHTELYVAPADARNVIPRIPDIYDEPFADSSQIPTYLVSALARQQVTVALSGDGGDEAFAGYNRYRHGVRLTRLFSRFPGALRKLCGTLLRSVPPSTYDRLATGLPTRLRAPQFGDKVHKVAALLELPAGDVYRFLVSQIRDPGLFLAAQEYRGILWDDELPRRLGGGVEAMQLLDMLTYLPEDILTKVDRASMAVSLEARVPILDHRVIEAAWRLPARMKLRGATSKFVLREILHRHVPRQLLDRPKMGFGVPIGEWLRGPLREWANDLLSPASLSRDGLLAPDPVQQLWREHLSGTRNWQYALWNVLMYQAWRDRWR